MKPSAPIDPRPPRHCRLAALALVLAGAAGCGSAAVNRSPVATDDPPRFARALQQEERTARENREAEARFYRQARVKSRALTLDTLPMLTSSTPTP